MLKTIKTSIFVMLAMLTPALVFAQDAAPAAEAAPTEDIGKLFQMMITAAQGGEWSLFVAVLIMVLVFLTTKVKIIDNFLPNKAKPWVAAVAGVLAAIAAVVIAGGSWLTAVLSGLVTGVAATGLWELIGKRFLKKTPPTDGV